MFKRASLLFHTLRYSKPSQLYLKFFGLAKHHLKLVRVPDAPTSLSGELHPAVAFVYHDDGNRREQIKRGEFRFLNRPENLGVPVDWQAARLPALWQYNLHYFNYLYLLEAAEQAELCSDWVRQNPMQSGTGWHPFPTSLRIVNWCKANFTDAGLLKSLYQQAAYLYRNYEAHHPGNHLLENARALIFAGNFFAGQGEASRWLEKGLAIFREQTPVQVLSDGGHFERSPMYHALMLEAYLDIINILPADAPDRNWLVEAAGSMSDFLFSLTKPDGEIALFNDATREIAAPPARLLNYAKGLLDYEAKKKNQFIESGYFIHQNPEVYLIIDGGRIAPDFLPAHAHADIFSFELSINGKPFVVDTGVFEYQAGAMRDFVRSTRAHNTVCIDNQDQAECWGSFRVGRRFLPFAVAFSNADGQSQFSGRFAGYAKLIGDGIIHQRIIACDDSRREIKVEDVIEGSGEHLVESLLHFHNQVDIAVQGNELTLSNDNVSCQLSIEAATFHLEDSWYCPEFGLKLKNKALVIGSRKKLPTRFALTFRY
ncbi:MAG: alginate lyase family protein [Acidobacteriota bacterium]